MTIAGGFKETAKHSQVLLFRRVSEQWMQATKLDMKKMLSAGNLSEDLHLRPGDMIYVPKNAISKIKPFLPVPTVGAGVYPTFRSCDRGSPGGTRVQETIFGKARRTTRGIPAFPTEGCDAPLFRHRRLVLWSFACYFSRGSIVAALLLPKQYQAEMQILLKRERVDPAVSSNKATVFETRSEVTEEQVQSEVELMRSRDLLENVVKVCVLFAGERLTTARAIGRPRSGRSQFTKHAGRVEPD